jgi:hydroxypyruvate isomerase
MNYSICIGAYRGQNLMDHLRKVKEHRLYGLEVYHW